MRPVPNGGLWPIAALLLLPLLAAAQVACEGEDCSEQLLPYNAEEAPGGLSLIDLGVGAGACSGGCSGRGSCNAGLCFCVSGWTGDRCEVAEGAESIAARATELAEELAALRPAARAAAAAALPAAAEASGPMEFWSSREAEYEDAPQFAEPAAEEADGLSREEPNARPFQVAFHEAETAAESARLAAERLFQVAQHESKQDAAERIRRAVAAARGAAASLPGHQFAWPGAASAAAASLVAGAAAPSVMGPCGLGCSGHGTCDEKAGECLCESGFVGRFCDTKPCEQDCNGNGVCLSGSCVCSLSFFGSACQNKRCDKDCSGNGYCFDGRCQCSGDFGGPSCSEVLHPSGVLRLTMERPSQQEGRGLATRQASTLRAGPRLQCPSGCMGRGSCRSGSCECHEGWAGIACQDACPGGDCALVVMRNQPASIAEQSGQVLSAQQHRSFLTSLLHAAAARRSPGRAAEVALEQAGPAQQHPKHLADLLAAAAHHA